MALDGEVATLHFLVVHLALGEGGLILTLQRIISGQLLEYGPTLLVAFAVVAVGALAVRVARDAGLEALAVLLEATAPLAAASLCVPVLTLGATLRCRLRIGRLFLLLVHGSIGPPGLVDAEVLPASERLVADGIDPRDADGALAHLRGARALRWLPDLVRDLSPEGVRVLLDDVRDGLRPDGVVVRVVAAIGTVTVRTAVRRPGEALAVELQALRVLAAAAFALSLRPSVRVTTANTTGVVDAGGRAQLGPRCDRSVIRQRLPHVVLRGVVPPLVLVLYVAAPVAERH